ncbi:RNA polymerase sigma factor SigY [Fontibacillus sp. BL9]|uniref:RNA polymerase sigma factor SigY n=1 Tax=Fontibacillus sp. BL9 TaxID=3389971 RepID=UPI00397D8F34
MSQEREQVLVQQAQKGDSAALASLMHEHYSFVYKYLVKITMDPKAAEDLAQDTMVRCMEKIDRYDGSSSFSSWLITIGTRLFIDKTRRKKREKSWMQQEESARKLRWHYENQQESWTDLLEQLFRLPTDQRIAILLKHYYGYTYDEIGSMLNIPSGTAKSRVSCGLSELRKEVGRHEG